MRTPWWAYLFPLLLVGTLACLPRHAEGPDLKPGQVYVFVYGCQQPFGCTGEASQVTAVYDGWATLIDGRKINLDQVLSIAPLQAMPVPPPPVDEPAEEEPEDPPTSLRVKL